MIISSASGAMERTRVAVSVLAWVWVVVDSLIGEASVPASRDFTQLRVGKSDGEDPVDLLHPPDAVDGHLAGAVEQGLGLLQDIGDGEEPYPAVAGLDAVSFEVPACHHVRVPVEDGVDRHEPEPAGEHPVPEGRVAASNDVPEDRAPDLDLGVRPDLLSNPVDELFGGDLHAFRLEDEHPALLAGG